jgi:hypothetical protein
MRWAAAVVLSGCVCVGDPMGDFLCPKGDECTTGYQCVAGRCLTGRPHGCNKMSENGLAITCTQPECAGQPCIFSSTSRGICCGDQCVDPADPTGLGNCGGCGNFCSSGVCRTYSSLPLILPPIVTGHCLDCPMSCRADQTCDTLPGDIGPACVCHRDSDCLAGQQCLLVPPADAGACWYPP